MTHTRRKPKRYWPKLLALVVLLLGAFLAWSFLSPNSETGPFLTWPPLSSDSNSGVTPHTDFPHFTAQARTADLTDTQYLKLVNRDRPISTGVGGTRLTTVWPALPVSTVDVTLHETAKQAITDLFAAAERAGIHNLFIASGFRSDAEQRQLYENAADRSFVMPPGHSEHQLGLAADILSTDDLISMTGSDEARWLAENAPRFGLIRRYPHDKQDITGVAYEPWHFRYVGRVHAWYMSTHDMVLEEYIQFLQTSGGLELTLDGRHYYVLYQRPEHGMIFVPEDLSFKVSTANTGGYIVTAWR
ncbi:MAG: M15 family metallopeptidase [Oscillospiraceae bacterium]|nr:M15 family metallopeptidase [Oscillospiraceae bacterium]